MSCKTSYIKLFILVAIGLSSLTLCGQRYKGDKFFEKHDFERALALYEKAYVSNFSDSHLTRKIANSYRKLGEVETSLIWFKRTLELDQSNQDDMLYYAEALKTVTKYQEAQKWYGYYNRLKPDDFRAISHLENQKYFESLTVDSARYGITKLAMNTELPEFGVCRYEKNQILFSSAGVVNPGMKQKFGLVENPYMDVYKAEVDEKGELNSIKKFDSNINSKFHDGPVAYDESHDEIYITRNNEKRGEPVLDDNGRVNLKIYRSKREDGEWQKPSELSFNGHEFSCAHPALSPDGQTLYFSSNRPGGIGGNDIYMCHREGEDWSVPVNLGRPINTEGDEMFPTTDEKGKLYFASDGHVGLGALDILHSEYVDGIWTVPQNMGYPVNSNKDDFGLIASKDGKSGYFSSNRGDNQVQDDIYRYKIRDLIQINADFAFKDELRHIPTEIYRMEEWEGIMMGSIDDYTSKNNPNLIDKDKLDGMSENGGWIVARSADGKEMRIPNEKGVYKMVWGGEKNGRDSTYFYVGDGAPKELNLGRFNLKKAKSLLEDYTFKATTIERGSGNPITGFNVSLYDAQTNEALDSGKTDVFGSIEFNFDPDKDYKMVFENKDWSSKTIRLNREFERGVFNVNETHDLRFSKLGLVGEKLDIENIYYDFDKYNIRQDAKPELEKVVKILNDNPTMNLMINSHTDSRGKASYNQWLSEKRAQSVVNYLTNRGIRKERLVAKGHGESALSNGCGDYNRCNSQQHQDNRRTEFVIIGI